ncbi:MAG: hypothetical protein AABY34_03290 [Pseudomonadota bacterium]
MLYQLRKILFMSIALLFVILFSFTAFATYRVQYNNHVTVTNGCSKAYDVRVTCLPSFFAACHSNDPLSVKQNIAVGQSYQFHVAACDITISGKGKDLGECSYEVGVLKGDPGGSNSDSAVKRNTSVIMQTGKPGACFVESNA